MYRSRKFYLVILSMFLFLVPTFSAHADLVNCGRSSNQSNACTICDLVAGIHGVIKFIVSLSAITGVVVIVIAGIFYIVSAGNTSMTSLAKSALKNTITGMVIILTAFVVITFIINNVFQATSKVDSWGLSGIATNAWTFKCEGGGATSTTGGTATGGTTTGGTTTGGTTTGGTTTGSGKIAAGSGEKNIRDQLAANNISVNKPAPTTEVNGLRQETLDGVVDFQKEVGKPIMVTGGSETGGPHKTGSASHSAGYKVDIDDTPTVNQYISSHYKDVPVSKTGRKDISKAYTDGKGNMYYKEGTHWDVCYKCGNVPYGY